MGRRQIDSEASRWTSVTLLVLGLVSCTLAYLFISNTLKPSNNGVPIADFDGLRLQDSDGINLERDNGNAGSQCCRGIPNLELWGPAVKWGTDHKFNSSEECCEACKAMCSVEDESCLCDSWVFCGNPKSCGSRFGECWLKKQKDTMAPQVHDTWSNSMWTSGLIFGKGEGIIGLETQHGTLRVKLRPDCAPYSVSNILELLAAHHCPGCHFYRAEGRENSWDSMGNHIEDASYGPPFALIQGTLEAAGMLFKKIPNEDCPTITRGAVAWVGSGPEFFISLANHGEWKGTYTVFGSVLPEDMLIAEKIAELPTKQDVWSNVMVSVLENPVPISIRRVKFSS